jgi:hypothetical protein
VTSNQALEILAPVEKRVAQEPRLAAHFIALLLRAPERAITVEFDAKNNVVFADNSEVKAFLNAVCGAKQLDQLREQCRALMFAPTTSDALGELACQANGRAHRFAVRQLAPEPSFKWHIAKQPT